MGSVSGIRVETIALGRAAGFLSAAVNESLWLTTRSIKHKWGYAASAMRMGRRDRTTERHMEHAGLHVFNVGTMGVYLLGYLL